MLDDAPSERTEVASKAEAGAGAADQLTDPAEVTAPGPSSFKVTDRRFWALDQEALEAEEERPKAPSYVEQLQRQLEEKDQKLREYIAAYKKEVVEGLEKTKQRLERDSAQRLELQLAKMALPMIEVLDTLDLSISAAEKSTDYPSLLKGVQMVQLLMVQKLRELGLTRMETVGRAFDPQLHEAVAVAQVKDPARDKTVIAEFKPGFMAGERVIRPALVQVGKLEP